MATGEAPAEVVANTETPEIVKTLQEAVRILLIKYLSLQADLYYALPIYHNILDFLFIHTYIYIYII